MGISLLTILTIRSNDSDIKCDAVQHGETKKWAGGISLWKNGRVHSLLIDEDKATHDTEKCAIERMERVVQDIREKTI